MHYNGVREVEIVRYANNILRIFCSFYYYFFFPSRDGGVNDFPTRTQQYSLASPFFSHILIRVSSSCGRWTGRYVRRGNVAQTIKERGSCRERRLATAGFNKCPSSLQ